jgi:hypothetical protein
LRRLALRWMQRLGEFRPHVAGAVWRGTANRHSSIQLDLYCDDPKAAELALVNRGEAFEAHVLVDERGRETTLLSLADRSPELADPVTVHLRVRDHDDLRGALKPDSRGQSWRGDLRALQRLVELNDAGQQAAGRTP